MRKIRKEHLRKSALGNVHVVRAHEIGSDDNIFNSKFQLLKTDNESRTHKSVCSKCGEDIYFYKSENGGFAVFDKLGVPWPKHGCFNEIGFTGNHSKNTTVTESKVEICLVLNKHFVSSGKKIPVRLCILKVVGSETEYFEVLLKTPPNEIKDVIFSSYVKSRLSKKKNLVKEKVYKLYFIYEDFTEEVDGTFIKKTSHKNTENIRIANVSFSECTSEHVDGRVKTSIDMIKRFKYGIDMGASRRPFIHISKEYCKLKKFEKDNAKILDSYFEELCADNDIVYKNGKIYKKLGNGEMKDYANIFVKKELLNKINSKLKFYEANIDYIYYCESFFSEILKIKQ